MDDVNTRRENALALALLPLRLIAFLLSAIYMAASVFVLLPLVVVLLGPADTLWILSLPVGLVSPRVGHRMASVVEPAADALDTCMDFVWWPIGRLVEFAL